MKRFLLFSILAVSAVLAQENGVLHAQSGPGRGGQNQLKIEGVISGVNLTTNKITIRLQNGRTAVVEVVAATKVERNGVRVPLRVFKIGDRGQALINAAGIASKIEAVGR